MEREGGAGCAAVPARRLADDACAFAPGWARLRCFWRRPVAGTAWNAAAPPGASACGSDERSGGGAEVRSFTPGGPLVRCSCRVLRCAPRARCRRSALLSAARGCSARQLRGAERRAAESLHLCPQRNPLRLARSERPARSWRDMAALAALRPPAARAARAPSVPQLAAFGRFSWRHGSRRRRRVRRAAERSSRRCTWRRVRKRRVLQGSCAAAQR